MRRIVSSSLSSPTEVLKTGSGSSAAPEAMDDYLQRSRPPLRSCITRNVMSEAPGAKPTIASVFES
jgi:hypothetical protein